MKSQPPSPRVTTLRLAGEREVALERLLGQGRRGAVYAGTLTGPGIPGSEVVVRMVDVSRHEPRHLAALARATAAAACVCDPRVVQVYDFDLSDARRAFVVAEFVEGGPLEAMVQGYERQGLRVPEAVALYVTLRVAEGLDAALKCCLPNGTPSPLIHGELGTYDVLVSWGGEVKVDGIGTLQARDVDTSARFREDEVGRLSTVAPEVVRGEAADARSDVFSMGLLLRRMLLGPRFSNHTPRPDAIKAIRQALLPATPADAKLPSELRAILKRSTSPRRDQRYTDAGEMAKALRQAAAAMKVPRDPAFLARAVEDAFAPELRRRERARASHPGVSEPTLAAAAPAPPPDDEPTGRLEAAVIEVQVRKERETPPPPKKTAPPLRPERPRPPLPPRNRRAPDSSPTLISPAKSGD